MRKKLTVLGITLMVMTAFAGCSPEQKRAKRKKKKR